MLVLVQNMQVWQPEKENCLELSPGELCSGNPEIRNVENPEADLVLGSVYLWRLLGITATATDNTKHYALMGKQTEIVPIKTEGIPDNQ